MTSLLYHVSNVLLLLTISTLSESFRVRRSGVAGYDDPYGLTNAFSGMDRPRRGDYRTLLRKRVLENDNSYFNPNAGSNLDINPMEYLRASRFSDLDRYLPEYAYQSADSPYESLERYPPPMTYGDFERGYGPKKRTAYKPHRVVPPIDELRSIFGEADVPMKRLAPVKRREPEKELDESIEMEESDKEKNEVEIDKTETANAWGKLISAAEKLSTNAVNTETNQETSKQEDNDDVTDKDLEDALSDNDVLGDNFESADDENNEEFESPVENEVEDKQVQSKSKRASSVGDSSDYVLGLLKEISDLKQRLYAGEMLRKLQDRENDYLANALKYATMDQIQESDQFIMNEYNDIAKATETEELIQQLSGGIEDLDTEDEEETTDTDFEDLEDLIEPEVKRSDEDSYGEEQWLDTPVEEDVGLGAVLEDDNDDELDGDDFLGSERPINIPYPDDDTEEEDEEDAIDTAVAEIANERNEEENIKGQEFLLAKLVNNLSPETLQSVIADLKEREAEALGNGVCSPLLELSQNCAFADAKGIPIDDEARSLCVRHQVCYTCGSALGLSARRCDEGYKGTVIAECESDVKCVRAAAYFLQLMSSRYHKYEEFSPRQCRNPCVADFIYGV
ncbi:uncharacterized protein LOC123554509 isoform X2 [Mercenaria mercenaria]|nr:uncharacterized protein LOC123554509 isoform X2 [Mercenaria mercenaria]